MQVLCGFVGGRRVVGGIGWHPTQIRLGQRLAYERRVVGGVTQRVSMAGHVPAVCSRLSAEPAGVSFLAAGPSPFNFAGPLP